ncbi:TetR family transcriptional regulator [Minwuia thermotolerans]|uniref:TetR family transcriptional regulator n=1 Tax=Minwuia thermotolerans TaxID=2056226 RepID=A0A2M9FZQ5_9PROT|nr:TetR family transcriptional regulator [Minwuia thermotolerans]PJK28961.1 TetR family transcriptional regulator [Minwuia thermotolerans]
MARAAAEGEGRDGAAMILNAALEVFVRDGFHGTSIRTIAKEAGVSIALIYYHFPSKEEILRTLMLKVTNDLRDELVAARAAAGPNPVDQMAALVRAHVRLHTARQAESFVGNTELRSLGPDALAEAMAARDAVSALYKEVIAAGLADGSFRCEAPAEANLAILTMCTSVAGWYRQGGPRSPDDLAGIYVGFALAILGAGEG